MATDVSLLIPSEGISWKGKVYESQLLALFKGPLSEIRNLVEDFRQQLELDNPTLKQEELEESFGRFFIEETFSGGKISLVFLRALKIVYPHELIDRLVHSENQEGVVWKLDGKDYAELVDSFMTSTLRITSATTDQGDSAANLPVKKTQGFEKKAKTKKADSVEPKPEPVTESVAVVVDPDVEVQLRAEELRSRRLEELRREMASLSAPEPKLVDLEVV